MKPKVFEAVKELRIDFPRRRRRPWFWLFPGPDVVTVTFDDRPLMLLPGDSLTLTFTVTQDFYDEGQET